MKTPRPTARSRLGFRFRVSAAIMAVVVVLTIGGIFWADHNAAAAAERAWQEEFNAGLSSHAAARRTRIAALTARCLALVRKSRIHAALEDDALDLLYPSARDELNDLMRPAAPGASSDSPLHAGFYRFLDAKGAVIPVEGDAAGRLSPAETRRLSLPRLPTGPQLGYLPGADPEKDPFHEIIATPIRSTANDRRIAALVVGFVAEPPDAQAGGTTIYRGLWLAPGLRLPGVSVETRAELAALLSANLAAPGSNRFRARVDLGGVPHLLLCQKLNDASLYPATFEVSLYSLAASMAARQRLRLKILAAGCLLIVAGLVLARFLAARLARPVEELEVRSIANADGRRNAEASLESTRVELQRAARFSADASHQLKTPVSVLRAGLQELLVREDVGPAARQEITTLLRETHRFTAMIEDLLLLSRMDAGRLAIAFAPLDLTLLVDSWIDDLSVRADDLNLRIVNQLPPTLSILGERRYTGHILANLLENARAYNRPDGLIKIEAHTDGPWARVRIGNNGEPIPLAAQAHVFERFHRAGASSGVPGHGLGLNLARELANLHGGDVRLVSSADDWTEFEVTLRLASAA